MTDLNLFQFQRFREKKRLDMSSRALRKLQQGQEAEPVKEEDNDEDSPQESVTPARGATFNAFSLVSYIF